MASRVRVGVGGWTFEPWRGGVFYPVGLPHKRELEFASRALSSIEINGTFYSSFKPDSWRRWRDETPDDFVFAVKASRYCTNRKQLATAGEAIERFFGQGIAEFGAKLGPINWQFAATKKFVAEDFDAFLNLLPRTLAGRPLQHAVEVRHPSFATPAFAALARAHGVAIVYATGEGLPQIDATTSSFAYARFMIAEADLDQGVSDKALDAIARRCRGWAKGGDVFVYFISAAKERNPAAAMALMKRLDGGRRPQARSSTAASISRRR